MDDRPNHALRAEPPSLLLRTVDRLAARSFAGDRPLATLLRLYIAANVVALALALTLGGPGANAQGAASAVWAWCHIG